MLGGLLSTFVLAFVVYGLGGVAPVRDDVVRRDLLGVAWVGAGIGVCCCSRHPRFRLLGGHGRALHGLRGRHGRVLRRTHVRTARLAPAISPKKSWEGFVGGVLAAVGMAFVHPVQGSRPTSCRSRSRSLLGLVIALAAVLGDLFESAVKRDLEVKDSGRVLGGHGGMLDRLDSLLWAGPAAYFAILAFGST